MPQMEESLAALLAGNAGVFALAGARIHPVAAPQDVLRPFVVYRVTSRAPFQPITGQPTLARARVTLTAWAETWTEARDLAAALRAALEGYAGPGVIQAARVITTAEGYDAAADLFGRTLDVNLIHSE